MLNHNLVYTASVRHYTITIPKESTNPEVDITILGPKQCYLLRELSINSNDTALRLIIIQKIIMLQAVLEAAWKA